MTQLKIALRWLLGILLLVAGWNHFRVPEFYTRIMPAYLPWHLELVYLSGLCEIVLGVLLLLPRWAPTAGWGTIALFVAVFPANVHMALHAEEFPQFSPLLLWLRLPLQAVLIAWAYWCTRPEAATTAGPPGKVGS